MSPRCFACLLFAILFMGTIVSCGKSPDKTSENKQPEENVQMDAAKDNAEPAKDNAEPAREDAEPAKNSDDAARDNAEPEPAAAPTDPEADAPEAKPAYITEMIVGEEEVMLPGVDIKIILDDKTKNYLIEKKETIMINAFLETYAEKLPKKYRKQQSTDGSLVIDKKEIEINPDSPETVIHHFACPRDLFDYLIENDTINIGFSVFSGRKSSPNNVLHCESGTYESSKIGGKEHEIPCRLLSTVLAD